MLATAFAAFCIGVQAAEPPAATSERADPPPRKALKVKKPTRVKKPMKMEEPMPIGMKREGMMKGDVGKAAAKKEAEMQPMIERERHTMPAADPKN